MVFLEERGGVVGVDVGVGCFAAAVIDSGGLVRLVLQLSRDGEGHRAILVVGGVLECQLTEQVESTGQVAGVETQLRQGQEVGGDEAVVLSLVLEEKLLQWANGCKIGLIS